jgi:ketosteroid isomerase-like protein
VAETNVELARRAFEGVLRGDLDLVKDLLDHDVKWHGGDPEAPGACRSRRQALAFIDRARERERDVELLDVVGAGDKVVEIVHYPDPEDALAAVGASARP